MGILDFLRLSTNTFRDISIQGKNLTMLLTANNLKKLFFSILFDPIYQLNNHGVEIMQDCECLPKCLFFNDKMSNMPKTAEMYKKKFCKTDNSNCARYMVFKALGREKVPDDLYPTSIDKVYQIIRGN